jgi:glycosyltransferase involved in cell wall biosynthesis
MAGTPAAAIAVVMPVYNRENTVGRAIESVLGQSFGDFEFLIVDDGSVDRSPAIISGFDDPRIRYLRQPRNLGGCAARNRGIREARSPLVSFIDSDDCFLPRKLAYVCEYFGRRPDIDVLIDSYSLRYRPEKERADVARINPVLNDSRRVEEAVFARRIYKPTPAITARRQSLRDAGLFDEALKRRQDMDLILRLTRHARCATTDQILWTKHWSGASISAEQKTFMYAMIEICKRHPQYLSRPEFRVGLARDMARHFLRLMRAGEFSSMAADAGIFAGFRGTASLAGLIAEGLSEILRRSREPAPSQCSRRTSSSSESTSGARSIKTSES